MSVDEIKKNAAKTIEKIKRTNDTHTRVDI